MQKTDKYVYNLIKQKKEVTFKTVVQSTNCQSNVATYIEFLEKKSGKNLLFSFLHFTALDELQKQAFSPALKNKRQY